MKIRLAAYLQPDSIVDGEGIRTVIWTQGCPHNCPLCQNPDTHDYNGGELVDLEDVYIAIDELEGQDGITFSGGDPFVQSKECAEIAKYVRRKGYNIWAYTGFTYEQIINLSKKFPEYMDFLKEIDVLVDGKFEMSKRSFDCVFRGSYNQRIIDVQMSLKSGHVVTVNKYDVKENVNYRSHAVGIYI